MFKFYTDLLLKDFPVCRLLHIGLENLKKKLLPYMEKVAAETELSMIFFMLTNILEESTELIYCGKNAKQLVADGFYTKAGENATVLPGVVSRKKQLIPAFMNALSA